MQGESRVRALDGGSPGPVLERFLAVNRERLRRARAALTPRQRDLLDLLPLVLHTNHPTLPGYLSQTTPAGIHRYTPGRHELAAAQRFTRAFAPHRRAVLRHEIEGLYLMGSPGSVAYGRGSDLDVWLCHTPGLAPARAAELREKAAELERWGARLGLDLHFFVFDAASFRAGATLELSTESSGSSQHCLLLDEFYRSGLVLCGRTPLWWLVPPEHEADYDDYVAELTERRRIRPEEWIDFGGIPRVPAEEFFGAAVWQLYKSISSPYKSVLKLLLVEVYADEHPDIDLLSLRHKRAVYDGRASTDALDPYLQMYERIEEYLMVRGDSARLDLLRRAFYVKVGEPLSRPPADERQRWRRELMESLVWRWGWERGRLALLDARNRWRIETVQRERRDLVNALTQSYRFLSAFARRQAGDARITGDDLTVLGRKLYAAFERKAGKVELLNRGFDADTSEPRLLLTEHTDAAGARAWSLSRVADGDETAGGQPLKRARSVVELLAWCHLNGLVGADTHLALGARHGALAPAELRQVSERLAALLGGQTLADPGVGELAAPPRLRAAELFVNVGIEPRHGNLKPGEHLASARNDPLNYGARRHNLVASVDLVSVSSWAEVFVFSGRGGDGLVACAAELLRRAGDPAAAPAPLVHCFTPGYGAQISARVGALLAELQAFFARPAARESGCYVVEVERRCHLLRYADGQPRHEPCGPLGALLKTLERPAPGFTEIRVAPGSLEQVPLPALARANRPGRIEVCAQAGADGVRVWVLDEGGALFHQRLCGQNPAAALEHYARFFAGTCARLGLRQDDVEYHYAVRAADGWRLQPLPAPAGLDRRYVEVQVLGDVDPAGATVFTVYCDGLELSSLEHGARVFEAAARCILQRRLSGLAYPIYITDIDLAPALLAKHGIDRLRTVHLLQYKRKIEAHLNKPRAAP